MTILQPTFDSAKSEAFAERLCGALNQGALATMTSIGHRSGLFDTLAGLPPATSKDIAEAAGLSERYVREWLAVMVTGAVVEYDPEGRTYRLPPEHAAWLTRAASPDNIAVTAQFVPFMGAMEDLILERFRSGGGTCYRDYPRFHEVMAEDSDQTVVAALTDHVLPVIPGLSNRLEEGLDVLDAGCGSGRALVTLARAFPRSRFVGYDLSEDAIAAGRAAAEAEGLSNLRLEARDLTGFHEPAAYDLVTTFDAVHDQKDPDGLLRGIRAALREDGVYLMQDVGGSSYLENNLDHPFGPLLYAVSCMHCTPVSLGQGGAGLGTMWGWELAQSMLKAAGFGTVTRHDLPHDPINMYVVARP